MKHSDFKAEPFLPHALEEHGSTTVRLRQTIPAKLIGRTRIEKQRSFSLRDAFTSGVACLALSGACLAQSTFGTIRGVVQDASGSVISDAAVTIHSTDENTDHVSSTNGDGEFEVENLKPGHYKITVHHDGFSDALVSSVALAARQDLRLPVSLAVASESTTVTVEADSASIDTEDGVIGDEKNNVQLTQLPLNNRATTTSPLGALGLSPNVQTDSQGNITVGGASSSMVNFSVDGISTSNVRQNGALADAYPSQEGISAMRVTAFNNSAEFSQVADVTFVTKSGSNQYHGSLFEYLQNDALDANPYGFTSKAPKRYNTFGGSIGGPIVIPHLYNGHDRTFFFATYEGNRRRLSVAQQFLVPTASQRAGDLTTLPTCVTNSDGSQNCTPGPIIPQASISNTATALLNAYYPLPNVSGQSKYNYEHFQATPAAQNGADIRIDQTINPKQSIYARFSRKNTTTELANNLLPNDVSSEYNRSLLVSHTFTITPSLLNEFRFGFTKVGTSVNFPIAGAAALSQLDLQSVDISQHLTTHAFPTFNFNNGTGFTPIGRDKAGITQSNTIQFADNVTFSKGKHTLKAGVDIRRVRYFDLESFAPTYASDDFGDFTFQPTPATPAIPARSAFYYLLTGQPTTAAFAVSSPDVTGLTWQTGVFAQDVYQLTPKLTASYGIRWTILPPFYLQGGNAASFDQRNNSIVVPDELPSYLAKNNLQASNLAFQQSFNACNLGVTSLPCTNYVTASQDHLPRGLRNTYFGNFQPRISLAYRPFGDTKTVVRAGFGIYTMTNLGPLSFNNSGNPTSSLHTYSNVQFPNTTPTGGSAAQIGGGGLDQGVDPNFRDPQSNQWNLTVERQLSRNDTLRVSYVGMHSYRLSITEDLNQLPASTTPFMTTTASPYVDPRSPYPNWLELYSTFNAGRANYTALETEVTHVTSHGLYFDASYNLAKNLADNQGDNPTAFAGEVNYGIPIADRFHVGADYGDVSGTRRNRGLISGAYQLPFGPGRGYLTSGWLSEILGGWELNTISLLESGPWLTPSISPSADQSNTNVVNRGAFLRPDVVSQNFYSGQSRARYFNIQAFQPTPTGAGRFGNAGVGTLQGPGTVAVSLGTAKVFQLHENLRLRFESSFTNVLNHTNFAPPATQIDQPGTFGVLSAAQTAENAGNRTGQGALRIEF